MVTITNRTTQMKRSITHIRTTCETITLTMDTLICITNMELMMTISQRMKKTGVSGRTMLITVTVWTTSGIPIVQGDRNTITKLYLLDMSMTTMKDTKPSITQNLTITIIMTITIMDYMVMVTMVQTTTTLWCMMKAILHSTMKITRITMIMYPHTIPLIIVLMITECHMMSMDTTQTDATAVIITRSSPCLSKKTPLLLKIVNKGKCLIWSTGPSFYCKIKLLKIRKAFITWWICVS